jgi:BolA protein
MTNASTNPGNGSPDGSLAAQIERRLAALEPDQLRVHNDSEKHRGHAGYDGSGESHFTVEIVAPVFAGLGRLQRQRLVMDALRDLLATRIHALAVRASAPGETR